MAFIRTFFQQGRVEEELFLQWSAQELRGKLFSSCEVLEERAEDEGAYFRVRGEPRVLDGLRKPFADAR